VGACILIVEDDAAIRVGLEDSVAHFGYRVDACADGIDGERRAVQGDYDLVLLDLALPGRDGMQVLAGIRTARPTLPVIVLTARGSVEQRVAGLRAGADDYLVKPFSLQELGARIEAVLRRSAERPGDLRTVAFPGGLADFERRELRFDDGARCELAEREAELLRYLARHADRAISRDELLARVWRIGGDARGTRSVDMQVARLRGKLRDDGAEPRVLLTVRGKGYKLAVCDGPAS